jgi:hypothetical protein
MPFTGQGQKKEIHCVWRKNTERRFVIGKDALISARARPEQRSFALAA